MHKIRGNRIWQIVYPILVYYLCYNLFFSILCLCFGTHLSHLFLLGVASLLTIPFCYQIYRKAPVVKAQKLLDKHTLGKECLYILAIVLWGLFLNYLITHTPLVALSKGYAQANSTLYVGSLWIKIFSNCICIPILEELVYRGIVCGQLQLWYDKKIAVFISAFCFGIMHFNVVQFLYGFLVGLVIAAVYAKTRKLWVVMVAHGVTNFAVVMLAGLG